MCIIFGLGCSCGQILLCTSHCVDWHFLSLGKSVKVTGPTLFTIFEPSLFVVGSFYRVYLEMVCCCSAWTCAIQWGVSTMNGFGEWTCQKCIILCISSIESQKGVNAVQWCSVENQKGVNAVQWCSVENQKGVNALFNDVLNENQKGVNAVQWCSVWEPEGC